MIYLCEDFVARSLIEYKIYKYQYKVFNIRWHRRKFGVSFWTISSRYSRFHRRWVPSITPAMGVISNLPTKNMFQSTIQVPEKYIQYSK